MIDIDHDALVDMCAAGSPRWSTERSGATAHTTNIYQASVGLRLALGESATVACVEWFNQRHLRAAQVVAVFGSAWLEVAGLKDPPGWQNWSEAGDAAIRTSEVGIDE